MDANYTVQIRDVLKDLFKLADNLDAQGLEKSIPFVSDTEGIRGTMKMDILRFIFRVVRREKTIDDACLQYINECLGYHFTALTLEMAREKSCNTKLPDICFLLPYFIRIDQKCSGHQLSSVYIKAAAYAVIGYLHYQEHTYLDEIVSYYRFTSMCIHMIEKSLGREIGFDPLDALTSDKMDLIRSAIETDQRIHPEEADPVVTAFEETLRKAIAGDSGRQQINRQSTSDDKQKPEAAIRFHVVGQAENQNAREKCCAGNAIDELDALVGLTEAKRQVRSMVNLLRVRDRCRELGISRSPISLHMVFIGNPGTGKTTVARILGKIYQENGILSKGHLVEASRDTLVGKYVGHTAPMVKDAFERAKGGVLFIDEAYSLTAEDAGGYGQEAVETLLMLMEDQRDDIVVIAAGYPALMQDFLDSNPGLRSRFPFVLHFPNYSGRELTRIFRHFCDENAILPSHRVLSAVEAHFTREASRNIRNYGNARAVRNYFEKMIVNQANRIVADDRWDRQTLCSFLKEDLPKDRILMQINWER